MGNNIAPRGGSLAQAVAAEIQRRMTEAGLSNRRFAQMLGVSHPYIGQRLSGEKDFTLDDIDRAATVFGVSPLDLIQQAQDNFSVRREPAPEDPEIPDWTQLAAHQPGYSFEDELAERMETP